MIYIENDREHESKGTTFELLNIGDAFCWEEEDVDDYCIKISDDSAVELSCGEILTFQPLDWVSIVNLNITIID